MIRNKNSEKKFGYDTEFKDGEFKVKRKLVPNEISGMKALKEFKKNTALIDINSVNFQADTESIATMGNVLSIANFMFNKAIAGGMAPADAYAAVYTNIVPWKDANNDWVKVTAEDIGNNLKTAMEAVQQILESYS